MMFPVKLRSNVVMLPVNNNRPCKARAWEIARYRAVLAEYRAFHGPQAGNKRRPENMSIRQLQNWRWFMWFEVSNRREEQRMARKRRAELVVVDANGIRHPRASLRILREFIPVEFDGGNAA